MALTLNQIIRRIRIIAEAHKQIKRFHKGLPSDFFTDKTNVYPAALLQDNGGTVSVGTKTTTLTFKMFLLDLVHVSEDSETNEQDVMSDMLSVAIDLVSQMAYPGFNDWQFSQDNPIQFVAEGGDDDGEMYAGVAIDFSISIMFPRNVCQVPSELLINETV